MNLCGHSSLTHCTTLETPTSTSSSVITSCPTTSFTSVSSFSTTLLSPVGLLTLTQLLVKSLFILFNESVDSVGELKRQALDLGLLDSVEDDDLVDLVERSL
jgi:hypothetical protein